MQDNEDFIVSCEARLIGKRKVTDSDGHTQSRHVIETIVEIAGEQWHRSHTQQQDRNVLPDVIGSTSDCGALYY